MFSIVEFNPHTGKREIGRYGSMHEAELALIARGVVMYERDADNSDYGDAFMLDGRVLSIQPVT